MLDFTFISLKRRKDNGVYAFWLNWKHTRTQSQVTCVIDNFRLSHIITRTHTHTHTQTRKCKRTHISLSAFRFYFWIFSIDFNSRVMNWEFICSITFPSFSVFKIIHLRCKYRWFLLLYFCDWQNALVNTFRSQFVSHKSFFYDSMTTRTIK